MGFLARLGASFKRTGVFFRDSWQELKKVRWPSRKEMVSYTIVVLVTVTMVAIFFYILDIIFSTVVKWITG
ncbi:preprotein translocase subunit SecE [Thermicanus aegyptius]|uniref:preprotein translocase subunit SecE n=1 Tax=Thermicanus aegyptius TaxID=94009 RepID=UPI000403FA37|nr:preprotein translocase subunit SecE [Thermicanus aegyptius]